MKQKKELPTFKEIIEGVEKLYFIASMSGASESTLSHIKDMGEEKGIPWRHRLRSMLPYFKQVWPGITLKHIEYQKYERGKTQDKRWRLFSVADEARTQPLRGKVLSDEAYNEWAKRVWKKKGHPKFGYRKVTGVLFGAGQLSTRKHRGWRRGYTTIADRFIGVRVHVDTVTGIARIVIDPGPRSPHEYGKSGRRSLLVK